MSNGYQLKMPGNASSAVVFSSPHSGSNYPPEFLAKSRLNEHELRSSEDAFVNELYSFAPDFGSPLLEATVSRSYVDLNRSRDDMDPAIVKGVKRKVTNPLVSAGLGVIPRVVAQGKVIRNGKLSIEEATARLNESYYPYHNCLKKLLSEQNQKSGIVVMFDCHSMPTEALKTAPMIKGKKPDVILGDRFGTTCDRWVSDAVETIFTDAGFNVARNAPFSGGFITRNYGRPSRGFHALQIEIARSIYMNEDKIEKRDDFADIQKQFASIVHKLSNLVPSVDRLAAE